MEPRSFNRGDGKNDALAKAVFNASMEPRSFNRGDGIESALDNTTKLKLQWSHGRLTVVTG